VRYKRTKFTRMLSVIELAQSDAVRGTSSACDQAVGRVSIDGNATRFRENRLRGSKRAKQQRNAPIAQVIYEDN